MGNLRVAVDVGGTFTDICILDESGGEVQVGKVPSSEDPITAVVDGVVSAGIDLRDVVFFLAFTALFLFLALRALGARAWRGLA